MHAQGGNDSFTTSVQSDLDLIFSFVLHNNIFFGDAGGEMSDFARGGDDLAVFSGIVGDEVIVAANDATGDAFTMSGHAVGGNDVLTGGDADTIEVSEFFQTVVDNILRGRMGSSLKDIPTRGQLPRNAR
jgi:hypothetical protein